MAGHTVTLRSFSKETPDVPAVAEPLYVSTGRV